jgi:precorrin-2/cobalt-factor-2 C20-methyltransferase
MKHKVFGVSLGPGDPELITLKALKVLKEADRIYYPGSLFKNGEKSSYSLKILEAYELHTEKLQGFYLEMNLDREQALKVYEHTFQKIKKDLENGYKIAVVSEGDVSTYSTFSYLLDKFYEEGILVQLIPGVTSFGLGASESRLPLALLNEEIKIIPRIQSTEELERAIASTTTVVLMKIRSVMAHIWPVLESGSISFSYCERLGTPQQFITTKLHEIQGRTIPYFSLIIIKKSNQQ